MNKIFCFVFGHKWLTIKEAFVGEGLMTFNLECTRCHLYDEETLHHLKRKDRIFKYCQYPNCNYGSLGAMGLTYFSVRVFGNYCFYHRHSLKPSV